MNAPFNIDSIQQDQRPRKGISDGAVARIQSIMPLVQFVCYFPSTAIPNLEGNSLLLHSHLSYVGLAQVATIR